MLFSDFKTIALGAASILAGTVVFSAQSASGQRVEPMRFELQTVGSGAQTTLRVTNTRTFPITIEAVPSLLSIDEEGAETLASADDDFLIFPPQAVIEPGQTQSFRVRYLGDGTLEASRAYRIGMNQLPIDMREDGESGVAVTVNFATLANVVPHDAESELAVETIALAEGGKWRILVANTGNRYARMSDLDLIFSQDDQKKAVDSKETKGWFDNNLVLPGQRIYVTMPAPKGFDPARTQMALVPSS